MKTRVMLGWLLAASASQLACAEGAGDRPRLPVHAATLQALVPSGYGIESKFDVDLDGDGLPDAAMLIAPNCADVADEGFPASAECVAEGRMLVVAFRNAKNGWRLSVSRPIDSGVGVHGDHFYGLDVRGRTVSLKGGEFSMAGARGSDQTLQFRYQRGEWILIGRVENRWIESDDSANDQGLCPELRLHAGERCSGLHRSTNFNTGVEESVWSIESGTDGSDEKPGTMTVRSKLAPQPPTRLADVDLTF